MRAFLKSVARKFGLILAPAGFLFGASIVAPDLMRHAAHAAGDVVVTWLCGTNQYCPVSNTNPLPVTGTGGGGVAANIQQWNGHTVDTGSGASSSGTLRVIPATDSPATPVTINTPPNDVAAGPQNFTNSTTGNLPVNSQGAGSVCVRVSGTFTGGAWTVQETTDGTGWANVQFWDISTGTVYSAQPSATATGTYCTGAAGNRQARINVTAIATGTLTASLNASAGSVQPPVGIQGTTTNITGIFGNVPATGNGATNSGTQRITLSSDSTGQVNVASLVTADPCTGSNKSTSAISSATTPLELVAGQATKQIYICALTIIAPSAVSVSINEGSSATCGTSNVGAIYGVPTSGTQANGMALAANGGFVVGNGNGTVGKTGFGGSTGNNLCLTQSGSAQLAGSLTYVIQ